MRVLVVGGTGVLRPAAEALRRAADVTVVSRDRSLPGVTMIRADLQRPGAVVPGVYDAALVYAPAVCPTALARLARRVSGRTVLLVTSAHVETPASRRLVARTGAVPLLLGWTGQQGAPRWHTQEEISAAALQVLRGGPPRRLGRLTPSSDRPA